MNTHPHIDTGRAWHERMAQARRWHFHRMTAHKRQAADHAALMVAAARAVARKMPGWTLATEPAPQDVVADYRRVIRRNLGNGRLP